ncbi:hypothetical protein [Flavobacterium kingsejongi]|uniref:Uncharacterized protein n=1 Tax=Flavobacterium kingsejongi TaxID=1678728 RepID=A0A2S1LPN1_9FLAO|nr:hypothetical protein [Flavobacterium kingsejongi]AWG25596.1 hypothetical protein FK004_10320 [Flavobacterium kingsejongi]
MSITLKDFEFEDNIDLVLHEIIKNSIVNCSAIGVNYNYYMFLDDRLLEISKRHFYQDSKLVNNFFNSDDVAFGFYVSKDYKQSRLKLDIKPFIVASLNDNISRNVLAFDFNFHSDLEEDKCQEQILSILKDVPSYTEESKKIMEIYYE